MTADNAFANEISQHPICAANRDIFHRLFYAVVSEGNDSRLSVKKIRAHFVGRKILLKIGMLHRLKQIIFFGKPAQNNIGQRNSVASVNIAKSVAVARRLQRHSAQHFIHVDFHETDDKILSLKRQTIHRHGNDNFFVVAVNIFYGNFRRAEVGIIEGV